MFEMSAFQILHGGNSKLTNSFDKANFCFALPPTQQHSFIKNEKFVFLNFGYLDLLGLESGFAYESIYRFKNTIVDGYSVVLCTFSDVLVTSLWLPFYK